MYYISKLLRLVFLGSLVTVCVLILIPTTSSLVLIVVFYLFVYFWSLKHYCAITNKIRAL